RHGAVDVTPPVEIRAAPAGSHAADDDADVVDVAGVYLRARNRQRLHDAVGVDERTIEGFVSLRIGTARGADDFTGGVDGRGAALLAAREQAEIGHDAVLPHERVLHDPEGRRLVGVGRAHDQTAVVDVARPAGTAAQVSERSARAV